MPGKYGHEVLGRHVVIQFLIRKKGKPGIRKPYLGEILKMEASLDKENDKLEVLHLVTFPHDGDEVWFDLEYEEQQHRLTWVQTPEEIAREEKLKASKKRGHDEVSELDSKQDAMSEGDNESKPPAVIKAPHVSSTTGVDATSGPSNPQGEHQSQSSKTAQPVAKKPRRDSTGSGRISVVKPKKNIFLNAPFAFSNANVMGHADSVPSATADSLVGSRQSQRKPKKKIWDHDGDEFALERKKKDKKDKKKKSKTITPERRRLTPVKNDYDDDDLPIWLDHFFHWMTTIPHPPKMSTITEGNARMVRRQITKLIRGQGIAYHRWPEGLIFKEGEKLDLNTTDLDAWHAEAKQWEKDYGKDKGNGWLMRHPISKLAVYQKETGHMTK